MLRSLLYTVSMKHSKLLARDQNSEQRLDFGSLPGKVRHNEPVAKLMSLPLFGCHFTGSQLVSPCIYSISFPVRGQPSIKVLFSKVQLQGIHPHGRCDIDPSPKVTSSITSLACPPVAVAAIST